MAPLQIVEFEKGSHSGFSGFYEMEGYTMFQDGFVLDVQGVRLPGHSDYVGIKAKDIDNLLLVHSLNSVLRSEN